jgi:hypothetical protein
MSKIAIQPGDKCKLVNLKVDSAEKIARLTKKLYDSYNAEVFKSRFNLIKDNPEKIEKVEILIEKLSETEKTKVSFAVCSVKFPPLAKFKCYIYTRHLATIFRASQHPMTNVFNSFWQPKNNSVK